MPRVKRGVQARARHKKILKKAKGYYFFLFCAFKYKPSLYTSSVKKLRSPHLCTFEPHQNPDAGHDN